MGRRIKPVEAHGYRSIDGLLVLGGIETGIHSISSGP